MMPCVFKMATGNTNTTYSLWAHIYVYKNIEKYLEIYTSTTSHLSPGQGESHQRGPKCCPQNFTFKGYVDDIS